MLTLTRINKIRLLVAGKHPWIDKMLDHRESLIKKYRKDSFPSLLKSTDFFT